MGLLDFNDPEVAFGIGLLGGGSFGQAAQRGLLGAQQTQSAAEERRIRAIQSQAAALELQRAQRADRNEQGLLGLQSQYFQPGTPGRAGNADVNSALPESMRIGQLPAVAPTAPKFDVQGYTGAALSQGYMTPLAASQLQQAMAKESGIDKLNPGNYTPASLQRYAQTRNYGDLQPRDKLEFVEGVGVNPYDPANANRSIPNPNKPFQMDASGRMFPNLPYQQYEKDKAAAGASRTSVNVSNNTTQETEQSKAYGKSLGDMRSQIMNAGFLAPGQLAKLDRLEQLLQGVDGGRLSKTGMEVASAANSFGIKLDPKLGNKEAAQALAVQMALGARPPGSGPTTDKDFDNFMTTVPDLAKTPEGRAQITKTTRAALQRDLQASKFSRDYAQKNRGVIDDGYFDALAQFYGANPVVGPQPQVPAQGWSIKPR